MLDDFGCFWISLRHLEPLARLPEMFWMGVKPHASCIPTISVKATFFSMYGPCGSHRSQAALKDAGTKVLELTDEIDVYICISHELMGQYARFYFLDASKDNAPRSWIW